MRKFRLSSLREVIPSTAKTCWWIVRITVGVSLLVFVLDRMDLLPWISRVLEPVFGRLGLPGEAALAYVSGYFVNVYSAVAVGVTLGLDARAMTILSVMVLCSHNIFVETAVQRKTGSPWVRLVVVRTLGGLLLGWLLNLLMPGSPDLPAAGKAVLAGAEEPFWSALGAWALGALKLSVKMTVLIFSLNLLQKILAETGVIRLLSRLLRPLLAVFGLPSRCSFLWIVANILGLAYGAAAMLEEVERGKLEQRDIDLLNLHIGISHSNLEDLILVASIGGIWWILLLSRWAMSLILVWGYRLELYIRKNAYLCKLKAEQEQINNNKQ